MFETQAIFSNCKVLKMNSFSSPERIIFYIENTHSVTILIEDNRKALRKRLLKSNRLDYVGPLIETKQLESKINRLLLSFSQTINLENEVGSTCVEYPTKEFDSFHHCDEDFVYQEMRLKYNLMPFWAAKTLDEVTKLQFYDTTSLKGRLPWRYLMEGAEESNCSHPCKSTKASKLSINTLIYIKYHMTDLWSCLAKDRETCKYSKWDPIRFSS